MIERRLSPNRTAGRGGQRVTGMVLHHTGGNFNAALNWTLNPASRVSYHYMINAAGQVTRTVRESDVAWHAGEWSMNRRTIGICGETNGWTDAARRAFVQLGREICNRYGITPNRWTIIRHSEVPRAGATACPGSLPIDAWVREIQGAAAPAPAPQPRRHTVQRGETLSGIAARYGRAGQWQALHNANRGVIGPNANRIRPGMVLTLPAGW